MKSFLWSALFLLPLAAQDEDEERIRAILKDLKKKEVETDHYKINAGEKTGEDLKEFLEKMYTIWGDALQVKPGEEKLSVIVHALEEDYKKDVKISSLAHYDKESGVLYGLAEASLFNNLARQGTHQFLHKSCKDYDKLPAWLKAGLALYFGSVDVAKDKSLKMNVVTTRENFNNAQTVKRLLKDRKFVPLKKLLDGKDPAEVQSWAFLWWLFNTNQAATVQKLVAGQAIGEVNWNKLDQDFTAYWKTLNIEIADREEGDWIVGETEHYTIRIQKGTKNAKLKWDEKMVMKDMKYKMELLFEKYGLAFRFDGRLSKRPLMRLYRSKTAYHKAGGPMGSAAYYSPATKELVGYEDSDDTGIVYQIFCHEGCHQFFDLAFPGFYDSEDLPMWFSEGLADCFGSSEIIGKDLHVFTLSGVATWRVDTIKEAIMSKEHPSIKDLLEMPRDDFMYNGGLHYAQSWSFCHFLWNSPNLVGGGGTYKEVVIKLIDGFKAGRPKDEVYRDAFQVKGKPIDLDQLEKEWKAYVKTLKAKKGR